MTAMNMTRRAYAASLGLAEVGKRGRMSVAANEAIAAAEKSGKTFTDSGVVRKVVKDTTVKAGAYDAKKVRTWAASVGIAVNARGRLSSEVLDAFAKANPTVPAEVVVSGVKVTGKDVRPHAPAKRSPRTEYLAVDRKGKTWRFSEREACKCGYSLSHCACGSPVVLGLDVTVTSR